MYIYLYIGFKTLLLSAFRRRLLFLGTHPGILDFNKSFIFLMEKGAKDKIHLNVSFMRKSFSIGKPYWYVPDDFTFEDSIINPEEHVFTYEDIEYRFVRAIRKYSYSDPYYNKEMKIWLLTGTEEAKEKLHTLDFVPMYSRDGEFQYPNGPIRNLIELGKSLGEEINQAKNSITD